MKLIHKTPNNFSLFPSLSSLFEEPCCSTNPKVPSLNISENDASYEVEIAAPGLSKKDFNLEIKEGCLRIACKREAKQKDQKEAHTLHYEFSYFNWQRSVYLPEDEVELKNIAANYQDGLLKISLPKKETKERAKQVIPIS